MLFVVITGLTLFFIGALWCAFDAKQRNPRWFLVLLFFPPIALAYYRKYWHATALVACIQVVGLALACIGSLALFGMHPSMFSDPSVLLRPQSTVVIKHDPKKVGRDFVSSPEAFILVSKNEEKNQFLSGRLLAESFHYDNALLHGGVLRLRQGDGFIGKKEIAIFLDINDTDITSHESFIVNPNSNEPPEIHLSWLMEGKHLPETKIFQGGYHLELQLSPYLKGRLNGRIKLIFPDQDKSYVSGKFTVVTNGLRYKDGQVNEHFDHVDTLEYVAAGYLETQYLEGNIASLLFEDTLLHRVSKKAETDVTVFLNDEKKEVRHLVFVKERHGWVVDSAKSRIISKKHSPTLSEQILSSYTSPVLKNQGVIDESKILTAVTINQDELNLYRGRRFIVKQKNGKYQTGVFKRIDNGRITLAVQKRGGVFEFFINIRDVDVVESDTGDVFEITYEEKESVRSRYNIDADVSMIKDFSRYIGKRVRVFGKNGQAKEGLFLRADKRELTLEVKLGKGKVEYFLAISQLKSIAVLQ